MSKIGIDSPSNTRYSIIAEALDNNGYLVKIHFLHFKDDTFMFTAKATGEGAKEMAELYKANQIRMYQVFSKEETAYVLRWIMAGTPKAKIIVRPDNTSGRQFMRVIDAATYYLNRWDKLASRPSDWPYPWTPYVFVVTTKRKMAIPDWGPEFVGAINIKRTGRVS